jgi:hypothetical protein
MKHLIFAFPAIFTLFFGIQDSYSQTLNYGDEIHLQNGYNNYSGGFLDTRGSQADFEKTGNFLCVSTAIENKREGGSSGTWKVLSATGKDIGTPVLHGDEIHLQNGYDNYTGGFLDTRGSQADFEKTGNLYCVSTAIDKKREGGSTGTWKVLSATGKANGTPVTQNSEVHLQNGYNNYSGGFLDTRGYQEEFEKTKNLLCVSTANEKNRQNLGSGVWKVQIAGTLTRTVICNPSTTIVEVTNSFTGKIWMDRNLGANRAATSSTDTQSFGSLFQWGRGADGHQCVNRYSGDGVTTSTNTLVNATVNTDTPPHGNFIIVNTSPNDWRSPQNDNLWKGVSRVNNPCPSGYRLPTETELNNERLSWVQAPISSTNNATGAFASPLKLPLAGRRGDSNGSLVVGTYGYYWSGTVSGTFARLLVFGSSNAYMYPDGRAYGFSVRCLKD